MVFPSRGFINDRFDFLILDHDTNVGSVVGLAEDSVLVGVLHAEIFEELHPQVFEPICIILE